jgi:hypothetical protein
MDTGQRRKQGPTAISQPLRRLSPRVYRLGGSGAIAKEVEEEQEAGPVTSKLTCKAAHNP